MIPTTVRKYQRFIGNKPTFTFSLTPSASAARRDSSWCIERSSRCLIGGSETLFAAKVSLSKLFEIGRLRLLGVRGQSLALGSSAFSKSNARQESSEQDFTTVSIGTPRQCLAQGRQQCDIGTLPLTMLCVFWFCSCKSVAFPTYFVHHLVIGRTRRIKGQVVLSA